MFAAVSAAEPPEAPELLELLQPDAKSANATRMDALIFFQKTCLITPRPFFA